MKRGFDRTERIADLIQKALAQILLQGNEERFRFVSITDVTVTKDLGYAKIYVSLLVDEKDEIAEIVDLLNRSAKALRYELAQEVKLRAIPELKFVYDESSAHGFKISSLIDKAVKK